MLEELKGIECSESIKPDTWSCGNRGFCVWVVFLIVVLDDKVIEAKARKIIDQGEFPDSAETSPKKAEGGGILELSSFPAVLDTLTMLSIGLLGWGRAMSSGVFQLSELD